LRDFYESVPDEVNRLASENRDLGDASERGEKLRRLRAGRRLLYLVHPWDVYDVDLPGNPTRVLQRAQLHDLLTWQRQRLATVLVEESAKRHSYLVDAAAAYGRVAAAIPGQPPVIPLQRPRVSIEAPSRIALAGKPLAEFSLGVKHHFEKPTDVWLLCDYNREFVEVLPRNPETLYDEAKREKIETLPPTFRLMRPDEERTVWIRVRRKAPSSADARLVIRAVGGPRLEDSGQAEAGQARCDWTSHDVTVELAQRPSVDLIVKGTVESWQPTKTGYVLHPFPNQITPYKLLLVNSDLEERVVDFEIVTTNDLDEALPPPGEASAATATAYLASAGAFDSVAKAEKFVVPPGNLPVAIPLATIPGAAPKDDPKPTTPAEQLAEPAKEPMVLSQRLLAVITDRMSGRRTIRSIEILPQRPARYVDTQVQYDPRRRQVEVRVRAVNPAALLNKRISITCRTEQTEAGFGSHIRRGTLLPPATEIQLSVAVPPDAGPIFPLLLDIDDFERAFRFEIPTDATSVTTVPESNRRGIRILNPLEGAVYGPRSEKVAATLQVDLPQGMLMDETSSVEVGLDVNRDRTLQGEESLRLSSDRQVDLFLGGIAVDGTLSVGTRVSDLYVTLPPARIEAAKANLIARLRLPAAEVWSNPIEVIFDGEAPQLSQLHVAPGPQIAQGGELEVSVLASDRELSGVARVEAAFDLQRRGEFAKEPPPLPGSLQSDGRWVAKLPTAALAPGMYTVLVRATDRQGNASEYLKTLLKVTPQEAAEATAKNQVDGTVVYGLLGKKPVDGAAVRLVGLGEEKRTYETTTDRSGRFSLDKVGPGEYRLVAEGLVGGNRRAGEASLKVPPRPAALTPVEVILQTPR